MKIQSLVYSIALCSLALTQASANTQVEMGIYNSDAGGNYRFNPVGNIGVDLSHYVMGKSTDGNWYGSFCIEKNENFTPGQVYDVAVSDRAKNGGVSSPTAGYDIISVGTAYLYTQFATGMLANSYYGSSNNAAKLQDLIWWLEGEQDSYGAGTYNLLLSAKFGANWEIEAKKDYTGSAVKVLNLTSGNNNRSINHNQDQLVYVGVPDGGMTFALLGLGLLGLALSKRRA